MYNFQKYDFIFDFNEKRNEELINNDKEQKIFNAKLKRKLFSIWHNYYTIFISQAKMME